MASRVLSRVLPVSAIAVASLGVLGCPYDFAAFENVPSVAAGDAAPSSGPAAVDSHDGAAPEVGPVDTATFAVVSQKPTVLVADATGIVFLTREGSILSCGHEGCALPGTIASNQKDARSLAIGYGFVAWTARGDNAVRRSSRTPGVGPAQQATDNDGVGAIALTATKMYWAVDAANNLIGTAGIRRCTPGLDCQYPTFDGFADNQVTELRIDGADAFWLLDNTVLGCSLAACDADSKNRVILANDPVLPFALTVDAEQIYYGSPVEGGSVRAVARSGITGGPSDGGGGAPRVIAKGVGAPTRLAVTPSSVWWTDPAGTVSRAPRNGGAAVVIASGLSMPTGIAVGGGFVYVTCAGDGRILRWKQD